MDPIAGQVLVKVNLPFRDIPYTVRELYEGLSKVERDMIISYLHEVDAPDVELVASQVGDRSLMFTMVKKW